MISASSLQGSTSYTSNNLAPYGAYGSLSVQPTDSGSILTTNNTSGGAISQPDAYAEQMLGAQAPYQAPYQAPVYYNPDGSVAASAAAAREAADTQAYYNDIANQLQGQIGGLDGQQNVGLQNIGNSYNRTLNRLDQQKGVARRDYDTGVQNNSRSYLGTRNGIMQNSRATNNALQRLLGMNGAGNSSAAFEQAPYAVGLQASQNLNGAQQTYATNGQSLDTGWQDTERGYKNNREDLDQQKFSQENSLRGSIAQTRATLLDKIANARVQAKVAGGSSYQQAAAARTPFQQQIDGLLQQITGYGAQYANPVMRAGDVSFKAPELGGYKLGQFGVGNTQQGGAQSDLNPAFANLLPREDEERLI